MLLECAYMVFLMSVDDCSILPYKSDFWPSFSVNTGVIDASVDCECFVVMMGDSLHFFEPDRLLLESGRPFEYDKTYEN